MTPQEYLDIRRQCMDWAVHLATSHVKWSDCDLDELADELFQWVTNDA